MMEFRYVCSCDPPLMSEWSATVELAEPDGDKADHQCRWHLETRQKVSSE